MLTLLSVVVVISILILVHEWGHFFVARRLGVTVEEFGFGFPPRIFSRMKNGVRYSLNLLPFGGFVKIFGEHGEGEGIKASFMSRPMWQRFLILAAGVGMNLLLAWIVFSVAAGIGVPQINDGGVEGVPVSIIGVAAGAPAERAGLKFGDAILEMRTPDVSLRIEKEQDVRDFVDAYRGEEILLRVRRAGEIREIFVTPRTRVPEGEGPLGILLGQLFVRRSAWYAAPLEGLWTVGRSIAAIAEGLWRVLAELVIKQKVSAAVSGPVGIFFFAQDSKALGIAFFLQFIGILSVNLAILNFLPIPALDGGRILFLLIEKLKGRRVDPKVENIAHTAGFVLLILLMILVTYRDIARLR